MELRPRVGDPVEEQSTHPTVGLIRQLAEYTVIRNLGVQRVFGIGITPARIAKYRRVDISAGVAPGQVISYLPPSQRFEPQVREARAAGLALHERLPYVGSAAYDMQCDACVFTFGVLDALVTEDVVRCLHVLQERGVRVFVLAWNCDSSYGALFGGEFTWEMTRPYEMVVSAGEGVSHLDRTTAFLFSERLCLGGVNWFVSVHRRRKSFTCFELGPRIETPMRTLPLEQALLPRTFGFVEGGFGSVAETVAYGDELVFFGQTAVVFAHKILLGELIAAAANRTPDAGLMRHLSATAQQWLRKNDIPPRYWASATALLPAIAVQAAAKSGAVAARMLRDSADDIKRAQLPANFLDSPTRVRWWHWCLLVLALTSAAPHAGAAFDTLLTVLVRLRGLGPMSWFTRVAALYGSISLLDLHLNGYLMSSRRAAWIICGVPVIEEWLKRQFWWVTPVGAWLESADVSQFAPRLIMHSVFRVCPFWLGVGLHAAWNYAAIYHAVPLSVVAPQCAWDLPVELARGSLEVMMPTAVLEYPLRLHEEAPIEGRFDFRAIPERDPIVAAERAGPVPARRVPIVPQSNTEAVYRAVTGRALLPKLPRSETTTEAFRAFIMNNLDLLFPNFVCRGATPWYQWLGRFAASRRAGLEEGRLRSRANGITKADRLHKAFIKKEHYPWCNSTRVKEGTPRLIQGETDTLLAFIGPAIHGFCKDLAASWGPEHFITYAPGLSAEALGQVASHMFVLPWRASGDANRYDARHHPEMLVIMYEAMAKLGLSPRVVDEMLVAAQTVAGKISGLFYEAIGTMPSGRADTSGTNSMLMGLTICFASVRDWIEAGLGDVRAALLAMRDRHLTRILVGGDDSAVASERPVGIVDTAAQLGYRIELESWLQPAQLEFFSGVFWPTTDGYVLGPKIGRLLCKIGWCIQPGTKLSSRSWLRANCLGYVQDVAHIPILRALVPRLLTVAPRCRTRLSDADATQRPRVSRAHEMGAEAQEWMSVRYGLPWSEVQRLETLMRGANLTTVWDDSALLAICEADYPSA